MANSQKLVLPLEYQEVEYIENTGTTQYIDTGWKRDFNKDFEIEAVIKPSTINKRYCIISDYSSQYQYNMSFEVTGDNFGRVFINAANNLVGTHIYNSNEFNIFKYSYDYTTPSGTVEVNSCSNSKTYQTEVRRIAADNARIFVDKDSRFSVFNYSFKLQKMRIKEDNVLIRNFIPCYRKSDNEAGLYDTVNDVFYTNQGTGSFTVGANVSSWQHSLRKLTTATEAVENPLYSDGSPITAYTIKGNEEHTGTPSPQNPVMPNGVGERTENLCPSSWTQGDIDSTTGADVVSSGAIRSDFIPIEPNKYYSIYRSIKGGFVKIRLYDNSKAYVGSGGTDRISLIIGGSGATPTNPLQGGDKFCCVQIISSSAKYMRIVDTTNNLSTAYMFVEGEYTEQTMPSYEPYGYKIPIPSGGVTTNIYLGNTQTVRAIKKLVLAGTENWTYESTYSRFYISVNDFASLGVRATPFMSNTFGSVSDGRPIADVPDNTIYSGSNSGADANKIYIKCTSYTSADEFKAYLQQQYATDTPVTIWYMLATAETAAVNEPLMKIGDYVDTLNNAVAIPTTEGANSISVDTTVQPSEFTATWTGWHNASVKEKSENLLSPDMTFNASCGYINDANCFPYSFGGNRQTAFFYCKPSTKYTFSAVNPDRLFIYEYNETKTAEELAEYTPENPLAADRLIAWQNPIADNPAPFETSATAKMVSISYSLNNVATDVMTNEGQTALPYKPYWT